MAKKTPSPQLFEIIVVLSIVAIVAVTGQVLIFYKMHDAGMTSTSNLMTGNVVAEEALQPVEYYDLGVANIDVNPPSPLVGQPFEVTATIKNEGKTDVEQPFYISIMFTPQTGGNVEPITVNTIMTKMIPVGESADASITVTAIAEEGPFRILATADATVKYDDKNPANNQRSKTVIIANS